MEGHPDETLKNIKSIRARGLLANLKRRWFLAGATTIAVGTGWPLAAIAQPTQGGAAGKKYRATVHVTVGDPAKWDRVLGLVLGFQGTGEKDLAIAMVVRGLATDVLKSDSPVAKGVSEAAGSGVEVVACQYSMRVRKVSREQMSSSVTTCVPFGGFEIVKR